MTEFDNIGRLMYLPLVNIEPGEEIPALEFAVTGAAEAILNAEGRNWVPIIVQETADYQYQVVSQHFIYAAAQKANLERVWCIVIDPKPNLIEQAKILAREVTPRVNLCTASRDTVLAALRYLEAQPGSALKGIDAIKVTNCLLESNRENWSDFKEIRKLKCGITTDKKLDSLQQVFYCEPIPKKAAPPLPKAISIKKAKRQEIFERLNYLYTYQIDGFEKINPDTTADLIFTETKGKWKSLTPITKLDCGISQKQIKTLKSVFIL